MILNEVPRAPDLFSYLQRALDEGRAGPFILTGSQHFLLSERISQSLAGRVALLDLLPFSLAGLDGGVLVYGGDEEYVHRGHIARPRCSARRWCRVLVRRGGGS